ncbi:MAG: hypothetical protein ACKO1H_00810 [Tabrizicola sp.]
MAGILWALNFGAKKNALAREESRPVDEPNLRGNCRPKLWIKNDDFAVTRAALNAADPWGDERVAPPPDRLTGRQLPFAERSPSSCRSNSFPNP